MYEDHFDEVNEYQTETPRRDRPFYAKVNNTALADGDDVYVVIPGIDGGDQRWGPVRWTPRAGDAGPTFPQKDDQALVQYDDFHNLWMYLWWPYA